MRLRIGTAFTVVVCALANVSTSDAQQEQRQQHPLKYWIAKQIRAARWIGSHASRDPWPNCPDPFDGGGTWYATVACENYGIWYDTPGFYRCGLQFHPMWERKFGQLCP